MAIRARSAADNGEAPALMRTITIVAAAPHTNPELPGAECTPGDAVSGVG